MPAGVRKPTEQALSLNIYEPKPASAPRARWLIDRRLPGPQLPSFRSRPGRPSGKPSMTQAFDAQNPPFDRLSHDQIETLKASLDVGYFRPGETIIERGRGCEHL